MSAITFDWVPAGKEAKTVIPAKVAESHSRNEEFRLALDRCIADYVVHQRGRAGATDSTVGTRSIRGDLARCAGWLRQWYRPLGAIREIWLFSQEMCGDWRQPRPALSEHQGVWSQSIRRPRIHFDRVAPGPTT